MLKFLLLLSLVAHNRIIVSCTETNSTNVKARPPKVPPTPPPSTPAIIISDGGNSSCGGDPNAQPGCGVNCGKRCVDYIRQIRNPVCILSCRLNGCDCKEGFYLDANLGKCVPPKQCTPICGANEVFSNCTNGGCQARNCSQYGQPVPCVKLDPRACIRGCVCKSGYLRASNGTCVPADQCILPCRDLNEIWVECAPTCPPQTCDSIGKIYHCPLQPAICRAACRCRTGYYRNANGVCVSKEDCLKCTSTNEVWDNCTKSCPPQTCDSIGKVFPCPLLPCSGACRCRTGYYRNASKICIPEKDCQQCNENESLVECPAFLCRLQNCSQNGYPVPFCPAHPANETCPVKPGCVCNAGYLRNNKGICIPHEQCPSCGGDPNARSGCGTNCGKLCSDYLNNVTNPVCPLICRSNSCDCKNGFYFDSNSRKCVRPEQCTPTCGQNEVYSSCVNGGCRRRNCSDYGGPILCIDPITCIGGCQCQEGYLRAINGTCILAEQCPFSTCGQNEVYSSCVNGGCRRRNCSDYGRPILCIDPITCIGGCLCREGYLRALNGTCILAEQCPFDSCNGDPNAERGCGTNCGKQCSDYLRNNTVRACSAACYLNGCDCKNGYYFDQNRKRCVLPPQCTLPCGQNEVYTSCVNGGCGPKNCSQYGAPRVCADPLHCIGGCQCNEGYLRALNGTCILADDCPSSSCEGDPNAEPGCGTNCGKHCSDLQRGNTNPACPLICRLNGCDCKDGYYLNPNTGKCVTAQQCPLVCGLNEVVSNCSNTLCRVQKCSELGTPVPCPPLLPNVTCVRGCICRNGYLRAENGTCIPENQCQPQCPRPNEVWDECAQTCPPQTCESIGKIYNCPLQPAVCRGACRCRTNYFRNASGVCIPQNDCPLNCGTNEVVTSCINGLCRAVNCSQVGRPIACPGLVPGSCRQGCICRDGYLRAQNGTCVPEKQCALPCPAGETYSTCPPVKCDAEYCPRTRNDPLTCPIGIICDPPRCVCGFNSHKNRSSGRCIATASCPPFPCNGSNEVYQACPPVCPGERCVDFLNNATCPRYRIGIVVPCTPQCRCRKGYYRNANNICVRASQCAKSTPPCSSSNTTTSPTTEAPSTDPNPQQQLLQANEGFTEKFLNALVQSNKGKSVIASPFSVLIPLGELCLYATGPSYDELSKALNIKTRNGIRKAFSALTRSYKTPQSNVNFSIAAKVYSNQHYTLSDAFLDDTRNVFEAEAQSLDFSNPTQAADIINKWVESETNNRIQDLVPPSALSEDTRLVLANAIYFKGDWIKEFNPNDTKERDFHINDQETIKLKTMYQKGSFGYAESTELDAKILRLLYKGGNFSFVAILPNKLTDLDNLISKLQGSSVLENAINSIENQNVRVYLPLMKILTTIDLSGILKKLGITKIFEYGDSGLSGILKTPEEIYVSTALQKAFIEVNEKGSEAAAANVVVVGTRTASLPPPLVYLFDADHPFIFYILREKIPLFGGVFRGVP